MRKANIAYALVSIMIAVLLFISVVSFIEPLRDQVSEARTGLHCSWDNLSTGEEMTCIIVDTSLPAYIGIGLAIALSYIGIKRLRTVGSEE